MLSSKGYCTLIRQAVMALKTGPPRYLVWQVSTSSPPPTHKAAITHTYGGYSAMTILPEATGLGNRHGRKKRVKISGAVPR